MAVINYFASPGSYNSGYFATVYEAALAIASPFLIQQKNQSLPGVNVTGKQVQYNNNVFNIDTNYINPGSGYYINTPVPFSSVWPNAQFPNAAFDAASSTFNATIDCVGFGSRVLIATGGNDPQDNALCLFHDQVNPDAVHFAIPGLVPTAFEFAVALPALNAGRWSYVAGSVNASAIQNEQDQQGKNYTGVSQGGFSGAQAGDILCFGYEDGESNGHFMVLAETPQSVALTEFAQLPGFVANAYAVSLYDSTADKFSLHFNDSRLNDGDGGSGVGFGQMYLFTNGVDEPVGFIFGPAGTGMEMPHFLYGLTDQQQGSLVVAAITVGRFE